jgi:hypothetical protein
MTEQHILDTSIANMEKLEGTFARMLSPILNSIWRAAAAQVDHGNLRGADIVVDRYGARLRELLLARYLRTGEVFGQLAISFYDTEKRYNVKKPLSPDFWNQMRIWAKNMAALQVKRVSLSTKKMIAAVVLRGIREGNGPAVIAKELRTTGIITSRTRANTIARTETHTAANFSTKTMVENLGATEKKWLDSSDKRVRDWHRNVMGGAWIKMEDYFSVGGDLMEAPGIGGGADNLINCRCVAMYR